MISVIRRVSTVHIPHYSSVHDSVVEVCLPRSNQEIADWKAKHLSDCIPRSVGFDCEWRPSFAGGVQNKVALVQVASEGSVLLVQLNRFEKTGFPEALEDIISSENIIKVGVGVANDLKMVVMDFNLKGKIKSFSDLNNAAKRLQQKVKESDLSNKYAGLSLSEEFLSFSSNSTFGLKTLARAFLGAEVPKPKRIRMSRWDTWELTDHQIKYAAYDALISRDVYEALRKKGIFEHRELNDYVTSQKQHLLGCGREQIKKFWWHVALESPTMRKLVVRRLVETDSEWLQNPSSGLSSYGEGENVDDTKQRPYSRSLLILLSRLGLSPLFVPAKRQNNYDNFKVSVVVNSRVLASAVSTISKDHAVEIACQDVIVDFLLLQQQLFTDDYDSDDIDLLSIYSGRERFPAKLLSYFVSKPTFIAA